MDGHVAAGLLIGTGVFALMTHLPEDEFMSWGWRVPLLISVLMLVIGVFIRISVLEPPESSDAAWTLLLAAQGVEGEGGGWRAFD